MDKEKLELIVFDIVNSAGTAKGLAYEALGEAEKGNYEEAEKLLKEADKSLLAAHNIQTEIIQAETSGDNMEVSVLFVHAQDHLMTTMTLREVALEMLNLYRKVEENNS